MSLKGWAGAGAAILWLILFIFALHVAVQTHWGWVVLVLGVFWFPAVVWLWPGKDMGSYDPAADPHSRHFDQDVFERSFKHRHFDQ
ncbi:hypothetical protein ACFW4K_02865 [Nocardiopsis alba]|uniref:hypothetical protein n=1 Tax=Nocardiopsis alba TaxID=53437 RepID=UPI00367087DC